jgi:mono/diheme cytochrome c family protein
MQWHGVIRRHGVLGLVALGLVVGAFGNRLEGAGQSAPTGRALAHAATPVPRQASVAVTPVEGPSTLHHLSRTIETSSMGWDGQWGPAPTNVPPAPSHAQSLNGPFVLTGADLYRISCRACHKPDGSGGPPEINSIIGPVQSASEQWMTERMKDRGRTDPKFIRELTAATEADLRQRFRVGGHDMPSFAHLSDAEIKVLRPYLDLLAGLSGAERQQRQITEPAPRVGELIIKGTCHVCHDATGPDTEPTTVLNGVIPPLSSMPRQKTPGQFVQKVRQGAPIPLGSGGVLSRGRMPVFDYLTESEVVSAFSYLITYPPK